MSEFPVYKRKSLFEDYQRPVTELDYDPEGRKGLAQIVADETALAAGTVGQNIGSAARKIGEGTYFETRPPSVRKREEARLFSKGDIGPPGLKTTYEMAKQRRLAEAQIKARQEQEFPEYKKENYLIEPDAEHIAGTPEFWASVGKKGLEYPVDMFYAALFGVGKKPRTILNPRTKKDFAIAEEGGAVTAFLELGAEIVDIAGSGADSALDWHLASQELIGSGEGWEDIWHDVGAVVYNVVSDVNVPVVNVVENLTETKKKIETARRISNEKISDLLQEHTGVGLPNKKEIQKVWRHFKKALQVPYAKRDTFLDSLAVAGAFAPAGLFKGTYRLSQLGLRNLNKGILVTGIVGQNLFDFKRVFSELPIRQIFHRNLAKDVQMPDGVYGLIKGSESFKQKMEDAYRLGGLPRKKAMEEHLRSYQDFVAAIGAGTMYGIADNFITDADEGTKLGFSVMGALLANYTYQQGKGLVRSGPKLVAGMLGLLNLSNPENQTKMFKQLSESDNQTLTPFRRDVFDALGYSGSELRQLRKTSVEEGTKVLREARVLREQGKISQAEKLITKHKESGLLNSKGKINEFHHAGLVAMESKFSRKTMGFAASFWKRIQEIEDPKVRDDFLSSFASTFKYMDDLSNKYPEHMKDFVLLLENATQITVLNSLRQSLLTEAQYTHKTGAFVSDSLVRDIDKYEEAIKHNIGSLRKVVGSLKGIDKTADDLFANVFKSLETSLVNPVYERSTKQLQEFKKIALQKGNKEREAAFRNEKIIHDMTKIQDEDTILRNGAIQLNLMNKAYEKAIRATNNRFDSIRKKYAGLSIDISDVLNPVNIQLNPELNNYFLKRFGEISPAKAAQLQKEIEEGYFLRALGEGVRKSDTGEIDSDALLNMAGTLLKNASPLKNNQKEAILDEIDELIQGGVDDSTFSMIVDILKNKGSIPVPAEINVDSFMALRQHLSRATNFHYRAGNFASFNDAKQRIAALDGILSSFSEESSEFAFKRDYAQARAFYKETLGEYNKPNSPIRRFVFDGEGKDQVVASHALFDSFFKDNAEMNLATFNKMFKNDDGNYDPEALDQLVFAFARKTMSGFGQPDYKSIDNVLQNYAPYFKDIFSKIPMPHGGQSFEDVFRSVAYNKTTAGEASLKSMEAASDLLERTLKDFNEDVFAILRKSAAQQLVQVDQTHLNDILIRLGQKPTKLEDDIEASLDNLTNSMFFNAPQNFKNRITNSTDFMKLDTQSKVNIENFLNSTQVSQILDSFYQKRIGSDPNEPLIKTILDDLKAEKVSPEEYNKIREHFRAILFDRFGEAMFPFVKGFSKEMGELGKQERYIVNEIAQQTGDFKENVRFMLDIRDPEYVQKAELIQRSPEFANNVRAKWGSPKFRQFGTIRKFNLDVELDPVSMETFYRQHRKLFDVLLDEEHKEAVHDLMQLSIITGAKPMSAAADRVRNAPHAMTAQMKLGRAYNAMKGVVSWRYLLMEHAIVNHRVAQASVMKTLLSDKNTAKVMRDILTKGIFRPKQFREAAKYWVSRLVPFGIKLKAGGLDIMEQDFQRLAGIITQEKNAEESNKE